MTRINARNPGLRHGLAAIWLLVILSLLTVVMGVVTSQVLAGRRLQDQRRDQMQAVWLARSGVELAAARLLENPANYQGESVEFLPRSQVQIEVKTQPGAPDAFVITSKARYPTDGQAMVRTLLRHFKRVSEKGQVRLEMVNERQPNHEGGNQSSDKK